MNTIKQQSGFSLIEVLIVVAIAAVVTVTVMWSGVFQESKVAGTEKLYEQTASLLSAIQSSGRIPNTNDELTSAYPALSTGFSIQRTGDQQQFVYLKHTAPEDFAQNRIAGMTNVADGAFMVYLGTVGLTTGVPSGSILPFAGSTIPTGWLLCDGRPLDKASYPDLFRAIQNSYGGSGSQFNLPDLRERTLVGATPAEVGNAFPLGQRGGSNSISLDALPSHNHVSSAMQNLQVPSTPLGQNIVTGWALEWGGYSGRVAAPNTSGQWTPVNLGNALSAYVGNSASTGNMQAYVAVNYIIKT